MKGENRKKGRPAGRTKSRQPIDRDMFLLLLDLIEESRMSPEKKRMIYGASVLLRYGGFRVSEIVGMTVADLHMLKAQNMIRLSNDTKTKKSRDAYFSDTAVREILAAFAHLPWGDANALLLSTRNSPYDIRSVASFTAMYNDVLHNLLGDRYSTHSFRSGNITDIVNAGVNIKVVSQHIGHCSVATTMRYVHVAERQKRMAVDVL